jgi:hypothetical protein
VADVGPQHAPKAISESGIRYSHFRLGPVRKQAGTHQRPFLSHLGPDFAQYSISASSGGSTHIPRCAIFFSTKGCRKEQNRKEGEEIETLVFPRNRKNGPLGRAG